MEGMKRDPSRCPEYLTFYGMKRDPSRCPEYLTFYI
jgi:hypothetical protein